MVIQMVISLPNTQFSKLYYNINVNFPKGYDPFSKPNDIHNLCVCMLSLW